MVSSPIIDGGLELGRVIHFGSLDFLTDDSAWHADVSLFEGTSLVVGSLHFHINNTGMLCLQDLVSNQLARQVPPRCLRRSSKPHLGYPVVQLVCMVNSDSLYPLLESSSDGEESFGGLASVEEVFMTNTDINNGDGHDAGLHNEGASNSGAGNDDGGVTHAAEPRVSKQLPCTPILGDSLTEEALEVSRMATLVEHGRLECLR